MTANGASARTSGGDIRVRTAIVGLTVLGAVGATVMFIAHLGYDLPLLGTIGPGRRLLPVALGFAVGAVLFGLAAVGLARRRAWSWPLALVVHALTLTAAAFPYRGWTSGVAIAVTLAAIALLIARPGRRALLPAARPARSSQDASHPRFH